MMPAMDDLTIRPATSADTQRLIDILYDDPPGDMRAIEPDVRKAKALGALAVRNGLEVAVSRTVVAVIGGRPVGLMEAKRPGERAHVSAIAIGNMLLRGLLIVGLGGGLRYVRYQRARARVQIDRAPDSYYIGELDVDPACRNRGIGARLLEYAEAEARAEGFGRMSLCTGITNPAQHLYERAGFRIVETRRHPDYERITGNPGRVLMVKELG
jgi:ribosomal protein S18 acetylase RimI-like enzyme